MERELPVRKSNRLKEYDYSSAGYYFITVCVKDKHELLSKVVGAATCRPHTELTDRPYTELTDTGEITDAAIRDISVKYPGVSVDKYVIMPNHVHLILAVAHDNGRQVAAPTIQTVIGHMKRAVSMQCGFSPWQKSFHDHIIRNEADYQRIWQYIDNNPLQWTEDEYFIEPTTH